MHPFVIVAGLTVMLGAKALSWYFNAKTEQEREQQDNERDRSEKIRQRARATYEYQENQRLKLIQEIAEEQSRLLLDAIAERHKAMAKVPDELEKLERLIIAEVADKTSSPYRKSALRREYARIEDAIIRMKEYFRYLDYEERQVRESMAKGHYDVVLGYNTAESLLPLEWLYPGKLVLINLDEVGRRLPRFGHRISFGKDDVVQKALALNYDDDIPVLIKSAHKQRDGLFYGCVARGALYYHHVMARQPAEFIVERVTVPVARGSLCNGLIRATLPLAQLQTPGMRLLAGQRLDVYPSQFDLCLWRNPFDHKCWGIEVSEFDYQARSVQAYQQLYLAIDERKLQDLPDNFFDPDAAWTLLNYQANDGAIVLGRSSVRVVCRPREDRLLLDVVAVEQAGSPQIGIDSPFRFTLIANTLADAAGVGWRDGVDEFLRFCAQSVLDMSDSPERLEQNRFFQRWERVIAYQRDREESCALQVEFQHVRLHENRLTICREALRETQWEYFDEVAKKLKEVLSDSNNLRVDSCVRLQRWDTERGDYLSAVRLDRRQPPLYSVECDSISVERDSISVEASFSLPDDFDGLLCLRVNIPNEPLKRQQQAMEDFFNDRLVNPALKNILLAPEHYQPEQEALPDEIIWFETLDDSQKRVVKLALRERNIALIQGPPGAGKTTAIVEMLYQLFRQCPSRRVLMVSQQNSAVDNVLSKFLKIHGDRFESAIKTIRIGNPDKMSAAVQPLGFDTQYQTFLKELDARAVQAAVTLPEDQTTLCHVWRATLQQAQQQRRMGGQDEFFITLLADRNLVGATCVGLATNKGGIDQLKFDVAIIDEGGRSTLPEILIPILRSTKVILVGDHYQLPPSIAPLLREDEASEELTFLRENFLSGSFFEMMFERLPPACREILDRQYRMAPAIGDLVGELFYTREGRRTLQNGHSDSHFNGYYLLEHSVYWVDVKGRQSKPLGSTSLENIEEAKEIGRFLHRLAGSVTKPTSVAVISAYSAQKKRILSELRKLGCSDGILGPLNIEVDTVDAFQGSEADVVCYSTVRTQGGLDFILDRKRLNVACSRARLHLLFFGHRDYLRRWRPDEGKGVNLFPDLMRYTIDKNIKFSLCDLGYENDLCGVRV